MDFSKNYEEGFIWKTLYLKEILDYIFRCFVLEPLCPWAFLEWWSIGSLPLARVQWSLQADLSSPSPRYSFLTCPMPRDWNSPLLTTPGPPLCCQTHQSATPGGPSPELENIDCQEYVNPLFAFSVTMNRILPNHPQWNQRWFHLVFVDVSFSFCWPIYF